MRFSLISLFSVALAAPAFAQTTDAAAAAPASPIMSIVPFAAVFAVFFFLVIRPQMKQAKLRQTTLDSLKKGDVVVTGGGAIGKITKLADDLAHIELAPGLEIKVLRTTVQGVYVKPDAAALAAAEQKRTANASKNDNAAPSKENVANDN